MLAQVFVVMVPLLWIAEDAVRFVYHLEALTILWGVAGHIGVVQLREPEVTALYILDGRRGKNFEN